VAAGLAGRVNRESRPEKILAADDDRSRPGVYAVAVKSFHLTTFGCQMNEHDSERMKGMLESLGYREATERAQADLILFNTCSIREAADGRFLSHLGEAKRLKREQPERVVGVGGCWAQSVKEEVFERFPFVDVAFGPGQVHRLAEFLTSDSLTAQGYFEFEGFTGHLPARREREFQGWLQISVGCNCACSYCIVPSTRGREVSRPIDELVREVTEMAADGVREVTLLGQNVNSYGRDLPAVPLPGGSPVPAGRGRPSFAALLRELDEIDGIDRIRYTSPHPKDMREDVIRAHAELGSVCEHIHLPLQSGSSRILKAMRRTYDRERYMDRVALIREHVPDVALTTDIIVGFPGETEEDFEQTLHVVQEVGYDSAFTFVFSPRRGTEAAEVTDGLVPHPVKVERMQRLVDLVQSRARERAQRFVGREVEVLVEGRSRTDPDRLRGRTRHNKVVNFAGLARPGELTRVQILAATSQTLSGQELLLSRAGAR
jgi:tRNA-2-methylthio-N6-dimethylallyladenosine synthase